MLIYIFLISVTILIMLILNIFVGMNKFNYTIEYTIIMILINILLVVLIDGIVAFFVNKLPSKWFNYRFKRFKIFKWERSLYDFLKIRQWKDLIPELGMLANFRKNKVEKPDDNTYIEKFLEQSIYGEVVHIVSIGLGFLIILLKPSQCLFFGIPVAVTNGIINFLSLSILRYNRPKLMLLYKRNQRKERKNNES